MTIAELIARLQAMPPNLEVILQQDGEGNGYSPLSDTDCFAIYEADTTWGGRVYATESSATDNYFETEDEWERFKASHPRCCVLVPVN